MKKLLLIASALLAFSFFGCTQSTNPDAGKSDAIVDSGDESTEVVLFEVKSSYQEEAHCKEIGNKTALSEFAGKTVVLTIEYLEGDRAGWRIGEVFFATDNADLYGTKTGKVDVEGTAATDNICTIEYPVDDVITAMGDAEYISINLWNETELVKISVK